MSDPGCVVPLLHIYRPQERAGTIVIGPVLMGLLAKTQPFVPVSQITHGPAVGGAEGRFQFCGFYFSELDSFE